MENTIQNNDEKIWGLYPGLLSPEEIDKLEEIDVWKKIDNLGGAIFWANHDAGKPWVKTPSAKELIEMQYTLEYLVYYTRNYGVEFSKAPTAEEHIEKSSSYIAWFGFWHNHFNSMSKEEYEQFVNDKYTGKDISKYMPTTSWKDVYAKRRIK